MGGGLEVRSYRAVFELERRVYRIDSLRLNPGGVPLRGFAYLLVLLALSVLFSAVPVLGGLLATVPWYLRELALPFTLAALLTLVRVDGRPFHLFVSALITYRFGPRELCALSRCTRLGARWRPQAIVFIPDGSDSGFRRLRYRGPGVVLVAYPHRRIEWGASRLRHADLSVLGAASGGAPLRRACALQLAPGRILETAVEQIV